MRDGQGVKREGGGGGRGKGAVTDSTHREVAGELCRFRVRQRGNSSRPDRLVQCCLRLRLQVIVDGLEWRDGLGVVPGRYHDFGIDSIPSTIPKSIHSIPSTRQTALIVL